MSYPAPFHVMAKPIGPICNIDCKYCFYLEKENLYPENQLEKNNWVMPDDVLEEYIKQKIESTDLEEESFTWQGGEPTLLDVEYFKKAVNLQRKYANGKKINNSFQTNGILLDNEWCKFFKDNSFLIGLSIDGPRELHDRYRVDKGGRPTFDRVMHGLSLLKKHNIDFNTLTVVQKDNSYYPIEVYNFLKEIGSGYMQFIPIVERVTRVNDNSIVSQSSVESEQFGNFLIEIFKQWVLKDVGKYFVQIFDVSLEAWLGLQASLCLFNETCGKAMAIEHNGDLYSCDHFVFLENKLGNIMENPLIKMLESEQQNKFGNDKKNTLPVYCKNCEVKFVCNGECPKNRFINTPDGEFGLNYLCAGYKKFFNYIDPCMNFMAGELKANRPPANVMRWIKENERKMQPVKIRRNDPCFCGSGKKYKNCCRG
ncbi:MAG: anaerobic sulfatase maturase [Ignavibacteriales bacterium CG_4_9_14_3_um_filter_30_11]|nr:MAG: anaerobic sulfatase maturase [Ignavibacteriales bacterium CG_4_9_14_3_um_filter_30_11]